MIFQTLFYTDNNPACGERFVERRIEAPHGGLVCRTAPRVQCRGDWFARVRSKNDRGEDAMLFPA